MRLVCVCVWTVDSFNLPSCHFAHSFAFRGNIIACCSMLYTHNAHLASFNSRFFFALFLLYLICNFCCRLQYAHISLYIMATESTMCDSMCVCVDVCWINDFLQWYTKQEHTAESKERTTPSFIHAKRKIKPNPKRSILYFSLCLYAQNIRTSSSS